MWKMNTVQLLMASVVVRCTNLPGLFGASSHGLGKLPGLGEKLNYMWLPTIDAKCIIVSPELGLCEYDWKADQLATDNYLNWASTHLPEALVKREFSDMSSMQAKQRKDSVGHISKKARTGSVLSVSIDDNSTHPSDNTLNFTPGLPPINSTTSASVPVAVPTITIPMVTHATSMPVVILPHTCDDPHHHCIYSTHHHTSNDPHDPHFWW